MSVVSSGGVDGLFELSTYAESCRKENHDLLFLVGYEQILSKLIRWALGLPSGFSGIENSFPEDE